MLSHFSADHLGCCCCQTAGTCYGTGRFEVSVAAGAAAVDTLLVRPRCWSADLGLATVAAAVEGTADTVAAVGTRRAGGRGTGSRCRLGLGSAAGGLGTGPGNLGSLLEYSLVGDIGSAGELEAGIRWAGCQFFGVSVPGSAGCSLRLRCVADSGPDSRCTTSCLQLLLTDFGRTIWRDSSDSATDLARSTHAWHGSSGSSFRARLLRHIDTA